MTEHDDNEFDEVRDAYRRDSDELPDTALDQRILAAAHRAVEPAPQMPNWRPGFAVAAVVVLSATLVITMRPPEPSAQPETTAIESLAEVTPAADDAVVATGVAAESELVDTIVVTGSRVSQDANDDAENRAAAAKAEPARRERAMQRAPQPQVASPAVPPDLPQRRELVAATETDTEGAEEATRDAAEPPEPKLLGIAAAVDIAAPAAPTDLRLIPIIDTWERGDADAALEALDELVANDAALTETELKAQLPEALFLAWLEQE